MENLLGGWVRHVGRLAPACEREPLLAAGREVLARYAEPHRRYHDQRHLAEVVAALALLSEHARALPVVVAAAWWHDAVYDVTAPAGANEAASASLAADTLTHLGADGHLAAAVARLVRLTADHAPAPEDADGAVLCDADLAVLAADEARYATYAADVRREYSHLPDEVFRAGRAAVLRGLLARDRLYSTPTAQQAWEATARANLGAELARLTH